MSARKQGAFTFVIPEGTPARACSSAKCGRTVYWIETAAGKRMPVDEDGTSYFATCPDADRFRKRVKK